MTEIGSVNGPLQLQALVLHFGPSMSQRHASAALSRLAGFAARPPPSWTGARAQWRGGSNSGGGGGDAGVRAEYDDAGGGVDGGEKDDEYDEGEDIDGLEFDDEPAWFEGSLGKVGGADGGVPEGMEAWATPLPGRAAGADAARGAGGSAPAAYDATGDRVGGGGGQQLLPLLQGCARRCAAVLLLRGGDERLEPMPSATAVLALARLGVYNHVGVVVSRRASQPTSRQAPPHQAGSQVARPLGTSSPLSCLV